MKKLMYAAMLLLGLSMMFSSCGGGTNKRSESYDNYYSNDAYEDDAYDYDEEDAYPNSTNVTTFSYQSDIMPYLRSYKFVASNGDYLTFTNSYIRNGQGGEIGVTQYELLGWDSETALINAHTPYGTPPITIYVYAAEGYIIIDDVMYFAK
jgi:hypothetical protein